MAAIVAHPELQDLRLWVLATADAHGLYAQYGFTALASAQRYMERRDAEVYARLTLAAGLATAGTPGLGTDRRQSGKLALRLSSAGLS